jgi:hypothetical protein
MADVWNQLASFATRVDRHDLAVDAYKHYVALKPAEADRLHRRRGSVPQAPEARRGARACGRSRPRVAPPPIVRSRASAHEMLAKIALAKHDTEAAREEARLAREEDRRCRCRCSSKDACSTTRASTPRRCRSSCRPAPS